MEQPRPIGYWLTLLEQLIEEHLNQVLAAEGVHRRHWQTMNLLKTRPAPNSRNVPATKKEITEQLGPFWSRSEVTVDEALEDLARRDWITTPEPYRLTVAGEAAHAALARIVERAAGQINDGVTTQEHANTVDVLRRMTGNAENLRRRTS